MAAAKPSPRMASFGCGLDESVPAEEFGARLQATDPGHRSVRDEDDVVERAHQGLRPAGA